ncbi:MAG: hypothetical protein CRU78_08390 [Candidatus Accumulibacter phosphatis]|uniref:Thoeris protein ThsB TIR-like domain-containing protein n=1 Tax=Candidatus Accumulibacter phosphatis TaxID=327160 RepID=A0A6A7RT88_9PROT|nr:hypothetical protein [Candidatus Accumulibacter phosphatis]
MGMFVSYTTRDHYIDRELLEVVSEVLAEYGPYYIDLLHNDSLDKQRHVELMLSKAQLLLLILSKSINKSEWVQWEIREARRSCIPIIAVQASSDRKETVSNLRSKLDSEFEKLTNKDRSCEATI